MAEVVINGSGEVEQVADRAVLRLSYGATGRDRTAAVAALTRLIGPVEALLVRAGVEVRARSLAVHTVWDGRRRAGSRADQSYALRVTDVTIMDDLVADLVTSEPASLVGPQWELAEPAAAAREARRRAVADARERAEGYAEALGARLGPVVQLTDGGAPGPVRAMAFGAARASAAPDVAELSLTPQPVTVSASCTVTWSLLT